MTLMTEAPEVRREYSLTERVLTEYRRLKKAHPGDAQLLNACRVDVRVAYMQDTGLPWEDCCVMQIPALQQIVEDWKGRKAA